MTCFAHKGFFLSLFFFLDVIATATLILDLSTITATFASGAVAKASRASRAGTCASRVTRVIRLIRPIRISRLFTRKKKTDYVAKGEFDDEYDEVEEEVHDTSKVSESEVGKRLSKLSSERVVVLVLTLVFAIPQFDTAAHFPVYQPLAVKGIEKLRIAYSDQVHWCRIANPSEQRTQRFVYESLFVNFIQTSSPSDSQPEPTSRLVWIGFSITNSSLVNDPCVIGNNSPWLTGLTPEEPTRLRYDGHYTNCDPTTLSSNGTSLSSTMDCPSQDLWPTEKVHVTSSHDSLHDGLYFEAIFDSTEYAKSEAFLSIYRTLIISAILGIGTYVFSNGAFALVLEPIERMMKKVDKIRENPLRATHIDDDAMKKNEMEKLRVLAKYNTAKNFFSKWFAKRQLVKFYQTRLDTDMLEKTIVRIGGLLAVGFGQAGAEIVAQNMASTTTGIDAMIPGRKIEAIFACIRIENFPLVACILQDKVMQFVNQICEIVYGIVDEYHGLVNRSNGDTFQVIWKLSTDSKKNMQIHDMAVAACAKIFTAIGRSIALREYSGLPPLVLKIPNFRVRVLFGLHRGWAIEGAIGSNMKIDPNYLSADVNISEVVGNSNTDYGTTVLVTDTVFRNCSKNIQKLLRLIDVLNMTNTKDHLKIYSLDLDRQCDLLTRYEIDNLVTMYQTQRGLSRFQQRREREKRKTSKWTIDMAESLNSDRYFIALRALYDNPLFAQTFLSGFMNYECGEWEIARDCFLKSRDMLSRIPITENSTDEQGQTTCIDGPSELMIRVMATHKFTSPISWNGARNLDT